MSQFYIPNSKIAPMVKFDSETNSYTIKGRSLVSNTAQFYDPIIDWIVEHLSEKEIVLRLELEYFNTSSQKHLLMVMNQINELNKNNLIVWAYDEDDDEMLDIGEKMQMMSGANVEFLAVD